MRFIFALLMIVWLNKTSIAAPIPQHLFPANTEPEVGWKWKVEDDNVLRDITYYVVYKVDREMCYIRTGQWFFGKGIVWKDFHSSPLTKCELRQLLRHLNVQPEK